MEAQNSHLRFWKFFFNLWNEIINAFNVVTSSSSRTKFRRHGLKFCFKTNRKCSRFCPWRDGDFYALFDVDCLLLSNNFDHVMPFLRLLVLLGNRKEIEYFATQSTQASGKRKTICRRFATLFKITLRKNS